MKLPHFLVILFSLTTSCADQPNSERESSSASSEKSEPGGLESILSNQGYTQSSGTSLHSGDINANAIYRTFVFDICIPQIVEYPDGSQELSDRSCRTKVLGGSSEDCRSEKEWRTHLFDDLMHLTMETSQKSLLLFGVLKPFNFEIIDYNSLPAFECKRENNCYFAPPGSERLLLAAEGVGGYTLRDECD